MGSTASLVGADARCGLCWTLAGNALAGEIDVDPGLASGKRGNS